VTRADPSAAAAPRRFPWADLVWTLVRTDFAARYHGTLGGFVWALLKPLTMFAALLAVFSFVFAAEPNYRINLLVGLFLWEFFAESTKVGLLSLAQKAYLLTKARLPAWIVVVTSISNPLLTLAVFAAAAIGWLALAGRLHGALSVALFLGYLALFVAVVVGFSLAASVLFLRYRDLHQVWDVVSQAGFFLTPIIWPIGAIPERYHFFLYLWPATPFVDFCRQALILGAVPTASAHAYLLVETALVLAVGVYLFRRLAPRAVEYL
jgi:ABC-type polysaccharide/polyol phosphate export permease